jgi:hypothetical protein
LRLALLGIELDFAEEKCIYTLSQKVHEAITGELPEPPEPPYGPGILVRVSKKKLVTMWEPERCTVAVEHVSNPDKCFEPILTTLERINSVVPINKLNKRRVTTYWILPALNYDFPSLEQKYRETMTVKNEIQSLAFDSSVIFDTKKGKWTLHHQSGAMWPEQLYTDYLQFKAKYIPEAFLFLEASMVDENMIKYSSEDIYNYLKVSLDYCKAHSDVFQRLWEGIL